MNSEKKQKSGNTKNKCVMCNLRDTINKFECLLYLKVLTENTNATDGMDQASFELTLLKGAFGKWLFIQIAFSTKMLPFFR